MKRGTLLEGIVVTPEGAPVAGAVVTSSAGGRTLSASDGSFALELELAPQATRIEIHAAHGAGRARASGKLEVALARPGSTNPGGIVTLARGTCAPSWVPAFGPAPGAGVEFVEVLDDGSGPALYASCGTLVEGLTVNHIAKWDGESWSALGDGLNDWWQALVVFDDGDGPALYAAGAFTTAGGAPANRIAKWDGNAWSALGTGLNDRARALAVFDDGGGPALYVAGEFTTAGGTPANRIAKWDGTSWSALGGGLSGNAYALAVFGGALHVGGGFTSIAGLGGISVNHVAKWDGTTWSRLEAGGVTGTNGTVYSLAVFDEGAGERLFLGGSFSTPGGLIARWSGSAWSQVGGGMGTDPYIGPLISRLEVIDDGSGPALFACGYFWGNGEGLAKWNGTSWSSFGTAPNWGSLAFRFGGDLAFFDYHGSPRWFLAGIGLAGGSGEGSPLIWDGATFSPWGEGVGASVTAATVFDDGGGDALFVATHATFAGGATVRGIGKWDGGGWAPLGTGFSGGIARALAVFDDGLGGGEALYAGGAFSQAGGVVAPRIARWNGRTWSALAGSFGGSNNNLRALAVFDGALYAGGRFTSPGNSIARWNGVGWSALGTGLTVAGGGADPEVRALVAHDDGSGPALYVGGNFNRANGVVMRGIARWNGSSWSSVGGGTNGPGWVHALAVWDDGSGPALYAGGSFTIGGVDTTIARWDGVAWSQLGAGVLGGGVHALAVFDDGTGGGPALYAAGSFHTAGGVAVANIARWDGASWSALESGLSDTVDTLAVYDDGSGFGPSLHAGGEFVAPDSGDAFLARWQGCDLSPPLLSCPSSVNAIDPLGSSPGEVVFFTVTASDTADPAPSVVCVPPSGSFFPQGTTLVTCTATDASGNESTCDFPVRVLPKFQQKQL